jgi:hypothetical protein
VSSFVGEHIERDAVATNIRLVEKEDVMAILFSLLIAVIILDLTALRWGADSSDGVDSPEWERRRQWPAFH